MVISQSNPARTRRSQQPAQTAHATAALARFALSDGLRADDSLQLLLADAAPETPIGRGDAGLGEDGERDRLYIIAEPVESGGRALQVGGAVVAAIRAAYETGDPADPVAALAAAVDAANEELYARNRALAPDYRVFLGVTCLVVRGRDLIICQVPPTQSLIAQDGAPIALPELASWHAGYQPRACEGPQGLGLQAEIVPLLYRAALEPGDLVTLCSSNLATLLDEDDLGPLLGDDPTAARDHLADLARQHRLDPAYALIVAPLGGPTTAPEQAPEPWHVELVGPGDRRQAGRGRSAGSIALVERGLREVRGWAGPWLRRQAVAGRGAVGHAPGRRQHQEDEHRGAWPGPRRDPAETRTIAGGDVALPFAFSARYAQTLAPSSEVPDADGFGHVAGPHPVRDDERTPDIDEFGYRYRGDAAWADDEDRGGVALGGPGHAESPPGAGDGEDEPDEFDIDPLDAEEDYAAEDEPTPRRLRGGHGGQAGQRGEEAGQRLADVGALLLLALTPVLAWLQLAGRGRAARGRVAGSYGDAGAYRIRTAGSPVGYRARGPRRPSWALALLGLVAVVALVVAATIGVRAQRASAAEARFADALADLASHREAAVASPDRAAGYGQLLALRERLDSLATEGRPQREERVATERGLLAQALDRVTGIERLGPAQVGVLAPLPTPPSASPARPQLVLGGGQQYLLLDGTIYAVDARAQALTKLLSRGERVGGVAVGQLLGIAWRLDRLIAFDEARAYVREAAAQGGQGDAWSALPLAAGGVKPVAADSFDGNLYLLAPERGQIVKYASGAYAAAPQPWSTTKASGDLALAVDLTIDANIYVLLADGRVLDFHQGEPKGMHAPALVPPLAGASAIHATPEGRYLYLIDPQEGRLVRLGRDGGVVGVYAAAPGSPAFTGARELVVDEVAGVAYLLTDDGVLGVRLPAPRQ